jgi:hypothetical protein
MRQQRRRGDADPTLVLGVLLGGHTAQLSSTDVMRALHGEAADALRGLVPFLHLLAAQQQGQQQQQRWQRCTRRGVCTSNSRRSSYAAAVLLHRDM